MTRILFTDDEPRILDGLRRMLRGQRREWDMVFALEGHAALAELEAGPFDVVVSDMRMPRIDGVEVLTQTKRLHPDAIRIVLSGHTDQADAARAAAVAHQFIMKPSSPDVVRGVMERVCGFRSQIPDEIRQAVGRLGSFPVAPSSHEALMSALQRPELSHDSLAGIIARDPGMAGKVLQAVNSSFFGVSRDVTDVTTAVRLLDPGLIRDLVVSGGIFHPFPTDPGLPFCADSLRAYSHRVATIAQREGGGKAELFTAGLLHDIGKLVLAETMPEAYARVLSRAAEDAVPLHDAETEVLGASHAQVGAYLLSLWNLPPTVVEAVAGHHSPEGQVGDAAEIASALRRAHEVAAAADERPRH